MVRGSGRQPGGSWQPEFPGQREPFTEGNTAAEVHGARSERKIGPRAAELAAALLADPATPQHLRRPEFGPAVQAWARAEAVASLLFDWLADLDITVMTTPRKAATKAPVDLWRSADAHAATLRARLGLDPLAAARIAKDLGLAHQAAEGALTAMAETGRALREGRQLRIAGGGDDTAA